MPTENAFQHLDDDSVIDWVNEQNRITEGALFTHPRFMAFQRSVLSALSPQNQAHEINHDDDSTYRAFMTTHSHPRGVLVQIDKLNYYRFSAGLWWLAEYGDPRDPAMKRILLQYSPLHNVRKNIHYPSILLQTSTSDDRVYPYHARAMAHKLAAMRKRVLFYEESNGGHSTDADLYQIALDQARNHIFLYRHLLESNLMISRTPYRAALFSQNRKRDRDEFEQTYDCASSP